MGALGGLSGLSGLSNFGAAPISKAGLIVWLDSSRVQGVADTAITDWLNRGSAGGNATASGDARATVQPDIQNNKAGMRFDGTDDEHNISYSTDMEDVSCFAVVNVTDFNAFHCIVAKTADTNDRNFYFICRLTSGTITLGFTSSAGIYEELSTAAGITAGATTVVGGTYESAADEFTVEHNGTITTGTETATVEQNNHGSNIEIGHEFSTENFTGDIFEVLVWTRTLSVTERTTVREYLADKWGVSL